MNHGNRNCVCGHSLSMHLTARYDNEPTAHHCGVDGCECQDFEDGELLPNQCGCCGSLDGGHTLACTALRQELGADKATGDQS